MKLAIEFVPLSKQRYKTAGDYFFKSAKKNHAEKTLVFRITKQPHYSYQLLIFLHEFIEAINCINCGIRFEDIDKWDMTFKGKGEPGDDPDSPYHHQHLTATAFEKGFCVALGMDWEEYNREIVG